MKVQGKNSSSKKTRALIKTTFAELINEKKNLNKITVTELVKRANITRSTFYTHYDDIYEVAKDYESEITELLINDDKILYSKEDIYHYLGDIAYYLKENENTYKLLLSSNESLFFLSKLQKLASEKIYFALQNMNYNFPQLELDVSFFIEGVISEFIKYFREQSNYTLDELIENAKRWFEKLF